MNLKEQAEHILTTAIESVKPEAVIQNQVKLADNHLVIKGETFDLSQFNRIFVIGAGKAAAFMAHALEDVLRDCIREGIVVVKYGHAMKCHKITVRKAGHPVVDSNSIRATAEILTLLEKVEKNDLVICLISGGGSALLERPAHTISLADLRSTFNLLLGCGATIDEINVVRKHLSLVKGGQLAQAIAPATCVSLIISDVIGDRLESIASGPTAADSSSFADAYQIVGKYDIENELPTIVKNYLLDGINGKNPETLKLGDPIFRKVHNFILANNLSALKAAHQKAEDMGFHSLILSSRIQGEARQAAKIIASLIEETVENQFPIPRPTCLLWGGETTISLQGSGKGGRNQELVLAALIALKEISAPYLFLSAGTDGTDGPTDAAGALITPEIWQAVDDHQLDPERFLVNNDAYHFFEQTGGLIKIGATGTNVMDLMIGLIP